jgi:hypothetical protein
MPQAKKTPCGVEPEMSKRSQQEILQNIRYHYQRSTSKADKGQLLDRLCGLLKWDRKHAIKVLRGHRGPERSARRGGPPKGQRGGPRCRYGPAETGVLKSLWLLSGQPCGKRLKPVVAGWLASWERKHGACQPGVRQNLLAMSAAQMDRLLRPFKVSGSKRRPGAENEVRAQIPLRTGPWETTGPGWIEADTVAHCGGDLRNPHAWSTVMTDIWSGWTEAGMTLNRSDLAIQPKIATLEGRLPFALIGIDTDNGGEFINHSLLRYWRQREHPVEVSRSRPYRKNDNAHVEQKNRTKIRDLLGHSRIESRVAIAHFDEALRLHSLLDNLFMPSMKLLRKEKAPSGRWRKVYEKEAHTPSQRVLSHPGLSAENRAKLERLTERHDPLALRKQVNQSLVLGQQAEQAHQAAKETAKGEAQRAKRTANSAA